MNGVHDRRRGLTVTEIVVVVLVTILIGVVALIGIDRARSSALNNQSKANFRRVGVGLSVYYDTFQSFPAVRR
jgi:hypothetical protein